MATALRGSASGGDSYTSCWMQQNCLVPFELSQPLGKGKGTPLRLWSSFSLLNKQIHKQTWQSTRSNTKHSLMFGCRACCTVKLCLIPWEFSPVLLMHSKLSVLFMWSRTSCPAHLGRHCPDWCPWAPGAFAIFCPGKYQILSFGNDAASSCFTLHHKHGQTLPKSTGQAHKWC